MRTPIASAIAAGLAALACVGCQTSDRIVHAEGKTIETEAMAELATQGIALAGSPDGKVFAEVKPLSDKEGEILVRDYETRSVKATFRAKDDGPLPLVFSRDGGALYALRGDRQSALVRLDLETGKEVLLRQLPIQGSPPFPGVRNADHTIVATDEAKYNLIVTAAGTTHVAPAKVLFDPTGNAWFKSGATWSKVDKNGNESQGLTPPKWLVKDQTHVRGSLRLVEKKQTVRYKDSEAYLSIVWLETSGEGQKDAAFVGVVTDLYAFGFVPGREAVYLVTNDGSYIVPLKTKANAEPGSKKGST